VSGDFYDDLLRSKPKTDALTKFKAAKPKKGIEGEFLSPVPLNWLCAAASLPGKALAVGIALWFLVGCRKTKTVSLPRRTMTRFSIGRKAAHRGLLLLEKAGLVHVRQMTGRSHIVTVLTSKPKKHRRKK
jgi:hypothetical protein